MPQFTLKHQIISSKNTDVSIDEAHANTIFYAKKSSFLVKYINILVGGNSITNCNTRSTKVIVLPMDMGQLDVVVGIEGDQYIREHRATIFFHQKIVLGVPQGGVNHKKVEFQSSWNSMLWVV